VRPNFAHHERSNQHRDPSIGNHAVGEKRPKQPSSKNPRAESQPHERNQNRHGKG
jgi:hypothetical protein